MDDMTAFERQLGTTLDRMGGPEPGFDAVAIATQAASTAPAGRWSVITRRLRIGRGPAPIEGGFSMFWAVKFVAAAAIVALFGGFLLSGLLATSGPDETSPAAVSASPSPVEAVDLLSRLQTEEVEPGVLRVIDDGIHDLGAGMHRVTVGGDSSVWVTSDQLVYRLGTTGSYVRPDVGVRFPTLEVDGAGRPWSRGEAQDGSEGLVSLEGGEWIMRKQVAPDEAFEDLSIAPDGTVWAMWTDAAGQGAIASFDGTEWQSFEGGAPRIPWSTWDGWGELLIDPDGAPWVNSPVAGELASDDSGPLYGFVDGEWQRGLTPRFGKVAVGPDGTRWLRYRKAPPADCGFNVMGPDCDYDPDSLAYFDGHEWHEMDETLGAIMAGESSFEVAPDRSLWTALHGPWTALEGTSREWEGSRRPPNEGCLGLGRFTPGDYDIYLPGRCVQAFDVAPDGAVWVVGREGLYVILPEAAAGEEA